MSVVTGGLVYPIHPPTPVVPNAATGGAHSIDWLRGNVQLVDLTGAGGDVDITFENPRDGEIYSLVVVRDGGGNDVASWPSNIRWTEPQPPTLSSSNNGNVYDLLQFIYLAEQDLYLAPAFDDEPYLRADGSRQLTNSWSAGGFDINGIDDLGVDGDATFFGAAHRFSNPAVVVTIGSAAAGGAPVLRLVKDDAATASLAFRNETVDRWILTHDATENLVLTRFSAVGSALDSLTFSGSTGAVTFPANLLCDAPNANDIGDATNYWQRAFVGQCILRDGITAPTAQASYAKQYVDTADGQQKTIFADGAIATVAPGVTCQSVVVIARDNTSQTVAASTALAVVFSASIPAGAMGANGILRVTLAGDFLNNTAGASTLLVRTRFGGTTTYQDTSLALANSANRRAVRLTYEVVNQNATNSQVQSGWITIGSAGAVTTGTSGDLATAAAAVTAPIAGAVSALDTNASARVVEISVQHSVSSAQIEFVKRYAFVELAPT